MPQKYPDKNTGPARESINEVKKKEFLQALRENMGLISYACSAVDIWPSKYYRWIERDPEFKEKVSEITDGVLDFVERKLHERIQEGDIRAIQYFLDAKAKSRGYNQTDNTLNISSASPVQIVLPFSQPPKALPPADDEDTDFIDITSEEP